MMEINRHYQESFCVDGYCDTYCSTFPERHQFNLAHVHRVFAQVKDTTVSCLEIGGGPTVHHLISASRICNKLVSSDLLENNCQEIRKWIQGDATAKNWKTHFKFVAKLEGYKDLELGSRDLEKRVRSKLKEVVFCDVRKSQPLGFEPQDLFDVIISRACLESACQTLDEFVESLVNVSTLLKPGGQLILITALGGDYYLIGKEKYHCLMLERHAVKDALRRAQLTLLDEQVFHYTPSENSNCHATLFTVSQKKS